MYLIALINILLLIHWSAAFSQDQNGQQLPKGYYAFAKVSSVNVRPPKVRKPPYLPIAAECPGVNDLNVFVPKNNVCGDLNRGFIPRNPMGQYVYGQPYPFEIIKNKTLQYLSKTLPYLKEEIDSVPKVARFVKPSEFFENHRNKRYRRQVDNNNNNFEDSKHEDKATKTENASTLANLAPMINTVVNNNSFGGGLNATKQNRQTGCEGNAICQAIESLKEEGPFSKSFLSNVVSAVGNVASINNVLSLVDQYSQSPNQSLMYPSSSANTIGSGGNSINNRFALSQLLSTVSSIGGGGGGGDSNSGGHHSSSNSGSSYSPLLSIIDYIQSLQTPKHATKRKTSPDVEDLLMEGSEKPQTPCTSTEEYISPTYARNYQGVWKYVVQIPNEGYFTQTIQQTSCLKTKCDLIEGSCRESPRWVSLLVAEIFYPDVYFPVNQLMPMLYKQQLIQQQQQQQQQQQPHHHHQQPQFQPQPGSYKPLASNMIINSNNNIKRPFTAPIAPNQINGLDFNVLTNLLKRNDLNINAATSATSSPSNLELLARKARAADPGTNIGENDPNNSNNNNDEQNVNGSSNNNNNNNNNADGTEKKHCDGYDKIGCYVVRVYYDWFLVNGSCKCWKTSSSSINETIKRIFIGKWKRK